MWLLDHTMYREKKAVKRVVKHLLMYIEQKQLKYILWSLAWRVVAPIVFVWWSSWWDVLVGCVVVIHCGRVVLVCRHCYCPFLLSIVVVCIVVTVGGALSFVVMALVSWWYVVVRGCGRARPFSAMCSSIMVKVVVVCFVLVSCGRGPLLSSSVSARRGEERPYTYLGSGSATRRVR